MKSPLPNSIQVVSAPAHAVAARSPGALLRRMAAALRKWVARLEGLDLLLCVALAVLALADMFLWAVQDGFPPVLACLALLWCGMLSTRLSARVTVLVLLPVTLVAWL